MSEQTVLNVVGRVAYFALGAVTVLFLFAIGAL